MKHKTLIVLAAAALTVAAWSGPVAAQKVYRWVDEHGVVHFGDAIPPKYSKQQHEVVDGRGVRTTVNAPLEASDTPAHDDRDRALLATYRSVEEIELVRDRRAGYLVSQNEVAQARLLGLLQRQEALKDNPAADNELSTVEQRIREYEAEIARRDIEITRIRNQFDEDIERFRELHELPAPDSNDQASNEP
jgi:hypothetical protein